MILTRGRNNEIWVSRGSARNVLGMVKPTERGYMVQHYVQIGQHKGFGGPTSWHESILDACRLLKRTH